MQFGVLLQVLFWDAVWGAVGDASDGAGARLTAGCCLGRSSGGAVGGAGVLSLLFGVCAGVMSQRLNRPTAGNKCHFVPVLQCFLVGRFETSICGSSKSIFGGHHEP